MPSMRLLKLVRRSASSFSSTFRKKQPPPKKSYILLTLPAAAFGLGVWQTQRRSWKLGLIENIHRGLMEAPHPLPADLSALIECSVSTSRAMEMEYTALRIRGTFIYEQQQLIGPRQPITVDSDEPKGGGIITAGNKPVMGYLVITPLRLSGTDDVILVNRGWVSKDTVEAGVACHPEEVVEFTGLLRSSEPWQPNMVRKEAEISNVWRRRDVAAIAQQVGAVPVLVDMRSESGKMPGLAEQRSLRQQHVPIPNQTRIHLRNEHLQYMITWFGLSAVLTAIWWSKYMR